MTTKSDSIERKIQKVDNQLIKYISKYLDKSVEEVRKDLAANLDWMTKNLSKEQKKVHGKERLLENIEYSLGEKHTLEEIKNAKESEKNDPEFLEMEKRVLATLSPKRREVVNAIHTYSLETDGAYFEPSYRQFITMLDSGKIQETEDSVKFLYANKELYRQELQLPLGGGVENDPEETHPDNWPLTEWGNFRGIIQRKSIRTRLLDEKSKDYEKIRIAIGELEKEGKYIATRDNTFKAIFDGLEGDMPQIIRTIQYFTEFVGQVMILLKRPFYTIFFNEKKENINIYREGPGSIQGSLLIAKDI